MVKRLMILLVLLALAMTGYAQEPPAGAALRLEAPATAMNVGTPVPVIVRLENAANLFGMQVTCLTDVPVISAPSVVFSTDWDPANRLEINNGVQPDGSLVFALALTQGAAAAINGNAGFAIVTYNAAAEGNATLRCTATGSDREGNALEIAEGVASVQVTNASVVVPPTVEPPTATPVPTETLPAPTLIPTSTDFPTLTPTELPTLESTTVPTIDPVLTTEPTVEIFPSPTTTIDPVLSPTPLATVDPILIPSATATVDQLLTPSPTATVDPALTPSPTSTLTPELTLTAPVEVIPTLAPTTAQGQISGAVIVPFAPDSSGVLVIFTPPDGNAVSAVLDASGGFVFLTSLPGIYLIDVSLPGYLPVRASLTLAEGEGLVLSPVSLQVGDTNRDGLVDVSDAALIAANFNGPAVTIEADLNRDGVIDIRDLTLLGSRYGLAGPLNWS